MGHEQSLPPETSHLEYVPSEGGFRQSAAAFDRVVMTAAPLGPLAVGMMAGIVAGERGGIGLISFLLVLSGASVLAAAPRMRRRFATLVVLAAGIGSGGVLHWSRERNIPASSVEHLVESRESIVRLRGRIVSEPHIPIKEESIFSPWQFREEQTAFLLRVEEVEGEDEWHEASGHIKVTIREPVLDTQEGDRVELFGKLVALNPPKNPGAFDWRAYYRQQGIVARMFCDQRENIVRLDREGPGFVSWLRLKTRGLLTDDISASAAEEASFLEAMVLGHRSRFDRRLNEVFTRAGCVHFIAASGTNIVILMGALWFAGRMVGLDKRRCAWVMIVAIVLYGVVAEARPPILRACVMGLMFCIALMIQRASSHFNWICAAAIVLCLIDPMTVFDAGFQLSFGAVLGVAYLAPAILDAFRKFYWWFRHVALRDPYARADQHLRKVAERFAPLNPRQRLRRMSWRFVQVAGVVVAVSVGAWLISLPITAHWFQRIQPWGVLSTVLIYPLMSAVMVLGFIKVGLAALSPTLAWVVTHTLTLIDAVMIGVVEWVAQLPAASPVVSPPPWWMIISFYLVLLAITLTFRPRLAASMELDGELKVSGLPAKRSRLTTGALASLVILAIASIGWRFNGKRESGLSITVLAVGAGSAIVMELPNGEKVLYDAGSLGNSGTGRNTIAPFLRHRGIHNIDRLYVSHPNMDHFSGIPELLAEVPTGPIIWNECFEPLSPPRSPAAKFIEHLNDVNHPLQAMGESKAWDIDEVEFERLWPAVGACAGLSPNDSSTVLKISYAGHSILLTGDIEEAAQRALIGRADLKADVLLLPHHGSVCATTGEFLQAVSAGVMIRSSNQRMDDTTNGLKKLVAKAHVYNTADCGAVTITIDENGLRVESWLACESKPEVDDEITQASRRQFAYPFATRYIFEILF